MGFSSQEIDYPKIRIKIKYLIIQKYLNEIKKQKIGLSIPLKTSILQKNSFLHDLSLIFFMPHNGVRT